MPKPPCPYFRVRATDSHQAPIESIDAEINSLPEHLGGKDVALIAVLDALKKYFEANPSLHRLEVEVVNEAG